MGDFCASVNIFHAANMFCDIRISLRRKASCDRGPQYAFFLAGMLYRSRWQLAPPLITPIDFGGNPGEKKENQNYFPTSQRNILAPQEQHISAT